jgi:predicted MFS family arabinose efflux permease
MSDTTAEDVDSLRPAVAAYALTLLFFVSLFNYMDRMVLAVLVEPIKAELGLSDSQLGLLTGFAFAALYATLGIPLARLADRKSRVVILSACLVLWSAMTAATGLARNFWQLFAIRMGVGVGEAGCVPSAHSMIGDLFPPEKRAFAISVFQAGGLAGLSGGLMLTGILADQIGWRLALCVVGLPGALLGVIILLTLKEPARRTTPQASPTGESALTVIKILLKRKALFHLTLGLSVGSFATYGLTQWIPAFFIRSHGLSLTQIGVWSGLAAGIGGILGVLAGGATAVKLLPRDRRWELWVPALAYAGSAPFYLAVFLWPSPYVAIAIKVVATFIAASGGGVALSAIQSFAEPNRRATAVSLVLFLSSLLGLGAGPFAVGLVSDLLEPRLGAESLRYALVISTGALIWAGAHFAMAARTARQDRI